MINNNNCPQFYDLILKWPETKPNTTIYQNCPTTFDPAENAQAYRKCHFTGKWTDKFGQPTDNLEESFSNFSACLSFNMKEVIWSDNFKFTDMIINHLSYLAIGGLILSILTLSLSVFILSKYRYLMNYRTKIHKQLFIALLLDTSIQLSIHIDLIRENFANVTIGSPNETTNVGQNVYWNLRIAVYEYFITGVFLWMLVEGVHIHNIIAVNVFHTKYWFNCYLFMGWIIPIPITLIWAGIMSGQYSILEKWYAPHQYRLYWIMASVRLICIATNILFLLNVIRVLVLKLRANNTSDICQAKTAIKAAVLLIPLLGLVNFVQMIEATMGTTGFFVLSLFQALLPAYQGLFVSIIFCLINKDVRLAVARSYNKYRTRKGGNIGFRMKTTNWDSRNRLQSNQHTFTSTLLSNTETKTNLDE